MRCRFIQFDLCAHFLNLPGLFFHGCHEARNRSFQFLNFAVFFQEFIQQHRVHCIVANGIRLSFLIRQHQVRINLFHIFGNEPKAVWTRGL
jgi:hypothetical protein